jgi:arylsulfatase A-like enzyme
MRSLYFLALVLLIASGAPAQSHVKLILDASGSMYNKLEDADSSISLAAVSTTAGGLPAETSAAPRPPNIVMILADDLGWSDLTGYGSDFHETPHIDRLAEEGVRFTSAYAAAPVCTPTRASIMTGMSPARLHTTVWFEASQDPPHDRKLVPPTTAGNLSHEHVTIAEALHSAGYFTAHVGKWHLGDAAHYPETHGFDVNIGGTFWGAPATFFHPYRGLWSTGTEMRYVPGLPWGQQGEYLTDRLTDEAIATMRRVKDRPFFIHLAYHTVHTPIEAKPEVVERYARNVRPERQHRNPVYAAMVHSLDENVGRIRAALEEMKVADRTIIVFTSDNGGYINQHRGLRVTDNRPLRSGKGSLYEGGIRVPLIVRWPGVTPEGETCGRIALSTDLYPTVLEMAGTTLPGTPDIERDSESLVPHLRDPRAAGRRGPVFWHYPHYYFFPKTTPISAVRDGDWKLIEFLEDRRVELFNLREDLGESQDLSRSRTDKADELRRTLHAWRKSVSAQMPTPNPAWIQP